MTTSDAAQTLERDLRGICGARLQSVVIYGQRAHTRKPHDRDHDHGTHEHAAIRTLAVVDALSASDLRACAALVARWHDSGLATPLIVASHEFERSLDAFPLEFGAIIADHVVVTGADPFEVLSVDAGDIRRACEVQARSHLLHLREGYLETAGRADALSVLIVQSAPAFTALVTSLARLEHAPNDDPAAAARHAERTLDVGPGSISGIVELAGVPEISSAYAEQLFPPYLNVVEKLVAYVDGWNARG